MLTIAQIANAAKIVAGEYPISRIHLFGSYAEERNTPESDVDMLGELDFDSFDKNEMMKRAVCMTVINIGELVKTEPAVKRSLTFSQPVFCIFYQLLFKKILFCVVI